VEVRVKKTKINTSISKTAKKTAANQLTAPKKSPLAPSTNSAERKAARKINPLKAPAIPITRWKIAANRSCIIWRRKRILMEGARWIKGS